MALLFMDGFDGGDYNLKYDSYATSRVSSNTTTRFSTGRSLAITKDIASFGWVRKYISPTAESYVGFSFMVNALGTLLMRGYGDSSATQHLTLNLQSNGALEVLRGPSTSLAITSPGLVAINQWMFIETKAIINATTGSVVVKLNGQTVINFTGNTKNGGTASSLDCVEILRSATDGTSYFDDIYICDNSGSAPYNTFLNEIRIYPLSPSGAGSSTQFTPSAGANYTAVDEIPYSTTDYVSSSTVGQRDTYVLGDLPASAANVLAVQTSIVAKKTDAAPIALKPAVVSSATVYYGNVTNLTTSDRAIVDLRTTDPSTSVAWTVSGVNALETGFEVA